MFSGSIFPHWRRKAERTSSRIPEMPFFLNAAYYPNWRIYQKQPPSSLRLGFVSHVFYAFAWYTDHAPVSMDNPLTNLACFVGSKKTELFMYLP